MEMVLLYMALALVLLLIVATIVATYEQLRSQVRLGQWRAEAEARRAFESPLAAQAREVHNPADPATTSTPPPPAGPPAQPRAVPTGVSRRTARPAVGQPSSGWTETEPMVLGGPSLAHFDPTELTPPRGSLGIRLPDAMDRKVTEPSATSDH